MKEKEKRPSCNSSRFYQPFNLIANLCKAGTAVAIYICVCEREMGVAKC